MSDYLLELFHQSTNYSAKGFAIEIGKSHLRVFSGSDHIQAYIRPPFCHLTTEWKDAGFDIYCFLNSCDITTWLQKNGLDATLHKTFSGDGFRYCAQEDGLFWWDYINGRGFFWGNTMQAFEPYRSKPFSRLFFWFFENQNLLWCHGACFGLHGEGVLIPGIGGAGKSTTTATALLNGFDFPGDDYLLINHESGEVSGMYSSLMLSNESAEMLRVFEAAKKLKPEFTGNKGKWCYHLHPAFAGQLKSTLQLKAILIPALSFEKKSGISGARPEEAMNAFVSSIQTAWLFGGNYSQLLRGFYQLTEKTPVYKLSIGTDLALLSGLLADFFKKTEYAG